MKHKKILTISEINSQDWGSKIGRLLVFIMGCVLASYAILQGIPWFGVILIIAGFLSFAMEETPTA
jgi:hypothetical protein